MLDTLLSDVKATIRMVFMQQRSSAMHLWYFDKMSLVMQIETCVSQKKSSFQ